MVPAWVAALQWQVRADLAGAWPRLLVLSAALYAVFVAYPFVLGRRARDSRDPYLAAVLASAMFFFGARAAFVAGRLAWMIGAVPVVEGAVLAVMLRSLLRLEPAGQRDLGRLALVAGAALAFVTVAIPLQLQHQWITIGWALEGAALAWLYRRIPHRGLLYSAVALLAVVFVRLALNPAVFVYEPRGSMRIFNWYLYTYLLGAAAMFVAGLVASRRPTIGWSAALRASSLLPARRRASCCSCCSTSRSPTSIATGPTIMFRFGVTVAQDLTYTIGWLVFGMVLLAAGIWLSNRPARVAAVTLIAVTTFKCFLYDLGSLGGLYRVASFVGLAISLALVSLALQKFVLEDKECDVKRAVAAICAVALTSLASLAVFAQTAREVTYERPVVTVGPGAQRLAIDDRLLRSGAPFRVRQRGDRFYAEDGLTDLRLVTEGGRPVPHLLIHASSPEREWIRGSVPGVAATKKTSGVDVDLGAPAAVDMIRVEGLPAPHLKRLTLEGSGDRAHWTMLVAEGTLFDLPDEQLRQNTLGFAAGPYRYFRITWNDANSGRVPNPAGVFARRAPVAAPPPAATLVAALERRPSEPGVSRYRVRLPGPITDRRAGSRGWFRRCRRPCLPSRDRERIAFRGAGGRARRARTRDAVARRPRRDHGFGTPNPGGRSSRGRARVDDRGRHQRGARPASSGGRA